MKTASELGKSIGKAGDSAWSTGYTDTQLKEGIPNPTSKCGMMQILTDFLS